MDDINLEVLKQQVEVAQRLQTKWLTRMEKMLDDGEITSSDMNTLYRFFADNGWTVDLNRLPKKLKSMLEGVSPKFDEDDKVTPIRSA